MTKNLGPPTFRATNLEDTGAPACFEVERHLKERMNIPVFHDDRHAHSGQAKAPPRSLLVDRTTHIFQP